MTKVNDVVHHRFDHDMLCNRSVVHGQLERCNPLFVELYAAEICLVVRM